MARKSNKQKAQELVDEVERLFFEAKTKQEKEKWANDTRLKMDEAIAFDPSNADAWKNRGRAGAHLGDHQDTIKNYDKAIELNPKNDIFWNNRGFEKSNLGDRQGAIKDYEKAIELNPKSDGAWNNRGNIKSHFGDYQGAMDDFNKAIELNPKNDTAWNNRAGVKRALGDYQGAIDDCTKAIDLDPENTVFWKNRAGAKGASGDHQGAIDDSTKAIELDSENADAWHNRGVAKYRSGDYDDAIKDLDEALRLNPMNIHAQQSRQGARIAKLREESGQDAIEHRKESRKRLDDLFKSLGWTLFWYRVAIFFLFVSLFIAILIYAISVFDLSCLWNESCSFIKPNDNSDLPSAIITTLSNFSFLSIIVFVFLWFIRLINAAAIRSEILRWDIFSRLNTEDKIDYYQNELGDNRNDIIIAYMEGWINKNLADKLLTLHSKKPTTSEKPENEMPQQGLKNLLEQLIKSNTKGD